ncbi:MAG: segregation/condensation protein A [candidate division Zixibacteria bacterium]|nr:segregation/condensation protein A [candidate division Zixibacteria bacterium]
MDNPIEEKEESFSSNYSVKLKVFEGPLDLLLFLIRRNEVDIYDIPISLVTQQYLEYIELIKSLDLEIAGEFILMAATLLRIKAKMLLPQTTDEEQEEDPREELDYALLEYKKYKQAAGRLENRQELESAYFKRSDFSFIQLPEEKELARGATLFDLFSAFREILEKAPKESFHEVEAENVSLEQRIEHILNCLKSKDGIIFEELFLDNPIRLVLVVTFIAILELVRLREIKIRQADNFAQIRVYRALSTN